MNKNFLVVGLGRFGRQIALKLSSFGCQVMAVDTDEKKVEAVIDYVTNAQVGDCTNEEYLKTLGVKDFDVCFVAIGDDFQSSLETTSYLKEMGARKVVSRAARDTQRKFLLRNGADAVVYPERDIGDWTAVRYSSDNIFDYIQLGGGYGVFEIAVPDDWVGCTIRELNVRRRFNVNIVAIKTGSQMEITTDAEYMLRPGQSMMVIGSTEDMEKMLADSKL